MSDSRAPSLRLSPAEFMAQQRRASNNDLAAATPTQMVCDSIEAVTGYVFVREVGSIPGGDEVHAEPYPRLAGGAITPGDLVMVAESIGRGESGGRSRFVLGPLGGVAVSSSAWDGAHLTMGNTHLWVDATGKLRIKAGPPTSDLDGVVVGSQI